MLTTETKKHIDAARQVLVGKVPNPISQVQEITNALIYKFMDDMDDRAASVGGKRRYFTGEFEKYSWRTIMNTKIGHQERFNLYDDALSKLSTSPNLPELFRDIFKNARIPYKDGQTLSLFLKEINYFDYKHSEELGNAYEYLLSIMGSQGDAGQFRTPRHIIDFIVNAVDPNKNDSVLDPACGTAGFLISAYKHVVSKHDGKDNTSGEYTAKEQLLTADEKKKLYANYHGFDVSDEMVKLSQVNMFLHGFTDPKIIVHNTLGSKDFWQDRYDVILANPPFMSPKGGVMPHDKFGIESSRAEVLFVDYILSHLKPSGRAGIIVPASISINDNARYFKDIRKTIVNNGLYAILELHDHVFKPYAEVTTHILLFDKNKKNISRIPIIKIKNDGYDKSDLRKEIKGSDIPQALKFILNNCQGSSNLDISYIELDEFWNSENFYLSDKLNSKATIGHLSGVPLGDVIEECKEKVNSKDIDVWSVSNKRGFVLSNDYFNKRVASKNISNYKIINPEYFAYNPSRINVGSIAYNKNPVQGAVSPMYQVFKIKNKEVLSGEYLIEILKSKSFLKIINDNIKGSTRKVIKIDKLKRIQIPLPKYEDQQLIVEELGTINNKINQKESEIADLINKSNSLIEASWMKSN